MDTTTIVLSIIGSGALFGFIQFLISRHDDRAGKASRLQAAVDKIAAELSSLREEFKLGRAVSARIRILGAADEVSHGIEHSREWWDQVMEDVGLYEKYCDAHPNFKNKKAVHAKDLLDSTYAERLNKNDFI